MTVIVPPPSHITSPKTSDRRAVRSLRRWRIIFFLLAIAFAVAAFFSFTSRPAPSSANESPDTHTSLLQNIGAWLSGLTQRSLAKNERVNLLIFGQGGAGHEGPYLTDTIVLLSLRPKSGDIVMLSIPRDLAVPVPDLGLKKVNSVNALGETREQGAGAAYAADVIGKTFNLPIAGYVRVDFRGFKELIDILGGITVNVPHTFTDPLFPDDEGSVNPVTFDAGIQHMDGARALVYVRSRHGTNGEGSDFARARRQQLVLLAVREKLLSSSTLLSPGKLADIARTLKNNVDTNIPFTQFDDLLSLARKSQGSTMAQRVLDSSPEGILSEQISPAGEYLLMPKEGDYNLLAAFVQNLFDYEDLRVENARVAVLNGTAETGLARITADELSAMGLTIVTAANAPSRNWHENVLFDLSDTKSFTKEFLHTHFFARIMKTVIPQEILNISTLHATQDVDLILILGK